MSQAQPMPASVRILGYIVERGVGPLTARQTRQAQRMSMREELRDAGVLTHGATGEKIRRPRGYSSKWHQLRGSIVSHVATYCGPCITHAEPRLHRTPRPVTS